MNNRYSFTIKKTMIIVLFMMTMAFLRIRGFRADQPERTWYNITCSLMYTGLFAGWGISVDIRIIRRGTKRLLEGIAAMMTLWMMIRTCKYFFTTDPDMLRWLWYSYYIPMMMIPSFAFAASLYLSKPENYKLPRKLFFLYIPGILLFILVLTNDIHQLVFRFNETISSWSNDDITYGPVYYLCMFWGSFLMLSALWLMLHRCRESKHHSIIWLPMLPALMILLYMILNVADQSLLTRLHLGDVTLFYCTMILAILEACIFSGLIQSNSGYKQLFKLGKLKALITDEAGHIYYRSEGADRLDTGMIGSVIKKGEMSTDPEVILRSHRVTGGYVIWETDISELTRLTERLEENKENLRDRMLLEQEQLKTKQEITELKERNRLYDILQRATSGEIQTLEKLFACYDQTEAVSNCSSDDSDHKMIPGYADISSMRAKQHQLLGRIAVLCAYVKRRGNLVFLGEKSRLIDIRDLVICFKESLSNLELLGVDCAVDFSGNGFIPYEEATRFYEFFETKIESVLDQMSALFLKIRQEDDDFWLIMEIESGMTEKDISRFVLSTKNRDIETTGYEEDMDDE